MAGTRDAAGTGRRLTTDTADGGRRIAPESRWFVLYDADCGFCKWTLGALLRRDRARRLVPVALQRPEADELLAAVPAEERMESWHLISPRGERWSAGAALPPLLRLLPGGRLPATAFARLPGLTERGYRWVTAHRSALSRVVPGGAKARAARLLDTREHANGEAHG